MADEKTLGAKMDAVLLQLEAQDGERQAMQEDIGEIYLCLMGPKEDHTKDGMTGEVNRNTSFRKNVTKLIWVTIPLVPALLTIGIWFFSNHLIAQIVAKTAGG